jgi:hypothetical protein
MIFPGRTGTPWPQQSDRSTRRRLQQEAPGIPPGYRRAARNRRHSYATATADFADFRALLLAWPFSLPAAPIRLLAVSITALVAHYFWCLDVLWTSTIITRVDVFSGSTIPRPPRFLGWSTSQHPVGRPFFCHARMTNTAHVPFLQSALRRAILDSICPFHATRSNHPNRRKMPDA